MRWWFLAVVVALLLSYSIIDALYGVSICEGCFGTHEYTSMSSPIGPVIVGD